MAKKKTTDAVAIIHNKFIKDDPAMEQLLEEVEVENEIARKIYELRTGAGLSQRELASMVNTQASVICRLEDADYDGHSLSMLRKIAKALNRRVEITFVPLEGTEAA